MSPDTHTKLFAGDDAHLLCLEEQVVLQNLGVDPASACPSSPALHRGQDVLSCQLNGWEAPLGESLDVKKTML